jgi:3,4-dihydroxy 2-butanone 4-phosphate synthase/GTP cyclohydrolase II
VADDVLRATSSRLATAAPADRPFVTLSYAQSLDGSIASADGRPLPLSSPPSLFRTHALRARHDGLLVGVGTVVSDDPQLTVRHAPGPNPQPVVLDTGLRTPGPARVFGHPRPPWFVCGAPMDASRRAAIVNAGGRVLEVPRTTTGLVDLRQAMRSLQREGLRSVMVEGGSRVARSFLEQGLVDWIVVTLTPVFIAGKPALAPGDRPLPRLRFVGWEASGPDLIVWGEPL